MSSKLKYIKEYKYEDNILNILEELYIMINNINLDISNISKIESMSNKNYDSKYFNKIKYINSIITNKEKEKKYDKFNK
jgi:hypothetical protein